MIGTLHHTQQESTDVTTFFFKPERPLRYVAGQFIEVSIPHESVDDRGIKRWFTLSSAPGHELLSVTTRKNDKPSSFKAKLWSLKPGESFEISEPMGDFVLPKDEKEPLVFVAGGIGITPFYSIVQWLIDAKQTRKIQFIQSVHLAGDEIFKETFNQPYIEKHYVVGEQLTAERIVEIVSGIDDKQVFISGPEPMTEAIVDQFAKLGLTQEQLVTDYFPGYESV